MKRMSESLKVESLDLSTPEGEHLFQKELDYDPAKILLYEIEGPLFFGVAQHFRDVLSNAQIRPEVVILRLRYVPMIDSTGFHRLREIIRYFQERKIPVLLSGVQEQLRADLERRDIYSVITRDRVFSNIDLALEYGRIVRSGKV